MASQKRSNRLTVYKHNPVLDTVLTVMFLSEIAALLYLMSPADLTTLGLCTVAAAVFIVVVKVSTRVVFGWVSRSLLGGPGFNDPLSHGDNMAKFCDQMWQLCIHAGMSAFEIYVLGDKDWFTNPEAVWTPVPRLQQHSSSLRMLYMLQLGVWLYTSFSHRFLEPRRKDYYVMYIHHVSTIALVGFSYCNHCLRIGLLVLIVHDISDIPIDLLKMFNLLKLEGSRGWFISEVIFVCNLGSWAYYRLYLFAFSVSKIAVLDAHRILAKHHPGQIWREPVLDEIDFWFPLACLLVVLWALHCWWFYLLLRIAYKIIWIPAHQAGREEYEGGSTSETEHPSDKVKTS